MFLTIKKALSLLMMNICICTMHAQNLVDVDGNTYKTIVIRNQKWMTENLRVTRFNDSTEINFIPDRMSWRSSYDPAYCWYRPDSSTDNNAFGALYNWYTVNSEKICPIGWHVPSNEDWRNLIDNIGGPFNAGEKLKDWNSGNWDENPTPERNETGFSALPGGYRDIHGKFKDIGIQACWWSSEELKTPEVYFAHLQSNVSNLQIHPTYNNEGFSIRCISDNEPVILYPQPQSVTHSISTDQYFEKDFPTENKDSTTIITGVCWNLSGNPTVLDHTIIIENEGVPIASISEDFRPSGKYFLRSFITVNDTTYYGNEVIFYRGYEKEFIIDIDGNLYPTINIGPYTWMAENLKTTRLNDSSQIPFVTDWFIWWNTEIPAYSFYKNDSIANKNIYGALYNWYSVGTKRLCPEGWRIPSNEDWEILIEYLGESEKAGDKLKDAGVNSWISRYGEANHQSGFNARPGGFRTQDGSDRGKNRYGAWWSSDIDDTGETNYYGLQDYNGKMSYYSAQQNEGYSVRCIKNNISTKSR